MEHPYQVYSFDEIPAWCWALFFVLFIFCLIVNWRVFTKAGQPGWASLVSIYNIYIMTKIAGKPGWWLLLFFIPFVNIYYGVWLTNMISKSFGKDEGFTAGLILHGIIFWPILAFGFAKYLGPYEDPAAFVAYQDQHMFDFEEPNRYFFTSE